MNELTFAHSAHWPWLLLAVPLWIGLWWLLCQRARATQRYGALLTERRPSPWARSVRLGLAATLLFTVYLEPRYGEEQMQVEKRGLDIVLALDTSRSMLARDMAPSRLDVAKRDILSVLPELRGGDRVGLIAFAGETRLVVPLTHDLDSFRQLLEPVDTDTVRKGGTDLAAAIREGLKLTEDSQEATTVIVLLTDGEDLTGASAQAAREALEKGVVVHAIGYGSTQGSKITLAESGKESFLKDEKGQEVVTAMKSDNLRKTVKLAKGEFLHAKVMALPLRQLKFKRLDPMVKRAYDTGEETVFKTRFQWVLIPAMLLLLLELYLVGGSRR